MVRGRHHQRVLGNISEWSDISVIQWANTGCSQNGTLEIVEAKTSMFYNTLGVKHASNLDIPSKLAYIACVIN